MIGCSILGWAACAPAGAPPPVPAPVVPTSPSAAASGSTAPAAPTAAAAAPPAQPPAQSTRPDVVRVSNTQGLAGALQIAIARGYFQEHGIDVQRQEFGNAAEAMVPLSRGDLDSGSIAPNA